MKSSVETLEPTKVKLTVEVPFDELKPHLDEVYKDLSSQVNVPGFRRGHVPARIIDQRIGRGYVIEQAVNQHLGEYYSQAMHDNELIPLASPEVDVTGLPAVEGTPGGDLVFTATVEVLPELEIASLEGHEVTVSPVAVSDEEIDAELTSLRERFASLKSVERAAKEGDFTSIDMTARIGDEEIESVSGVSYEVGSGTMLDGMDEALTGLEAGKETTFTSKLRGGEHAGEEATINLTLNSVKERELPEVDEDFVQLASEFDTVEELRNDLAEQVKSRKSADQAIEARDQIMTHLRETVDVPLPQGLLERELDSRTGEDMSDEDKKKLEEDLRGGLRDQILLDRIARDRNVEVGQRELFEYIMAMSQNYGIDASQLLGDQNQVAMIVEELTRNKAVAAMLREVTIKDTDGNDVDLSGLLGSQEDEEDVEAGAAAAAKAAEEATESE